MASKLNTEFKKLREAVSKTSRPDNPKAERRSWQYTKGSFWASILVGLITIKLACIANNASQASLILAEKSDSSRELMNTLVSMFKNQHTEIRNLVIADSLLLINVNLSKEGNNTGRHQLNDLDESAKNESIAAVKSIEAMCEKIQTKYSEFVNSTASSITSDNYKEKFPLQREFVEGVIKLMQEQKSNKFIRSSNNAETYWNEYKKREDPVLMALKMGTPEDPDTANRNAPLSQKRLEQKREALKDFLEWINTVVNYVSYDAMIELNRLNNKK
jgi:hypothetical protein